MSKRKVGAAFLIIHYYNEENKKKRNWSREWLLKRKKFTHLNLLDELKVSSTSDLRNFLRMDYTQFKVLLDKIKPLITKQNTVMREAISPEERLSITLRFLATGRSFEDLKFSCAISPQSLRIIIPETCMAIYETLKTEYIKFLNSESEWLRQERDFEQTWNFPHCCGAIDGKHIRIAPPPHSGSYYFNYKGFFSVVMMAIVNANYEFIMVDVGTNGRVSDGGVIQNTKFYKKLIANELSLPGDSPLPNSNNNTPIPRVFVADDAFGLSRNIIKPFSKKNLSQDEIIFNYRLSRARRVVENAFGILSSRFRIFLTTINLKPKTVEYIVLASCVLHNFLRQEIRQSYTPSRSLDFENIENGTIEEGEWRQEMNLLSLQTSQNRHPTDDAKQIREHFKNYLNNEGIVHWQNRMI